MSVTKLCSLLRTNVPIQQYLSQSCLKRPGSLTFTDINSERTLCFSTERTRRHFNHKKHTTILISRDINIYSHVLSLLGGRAAKVCWETFPLHPHCPHNSTWVSSLIGFAKTKLTNHKVEAVSVLLQRTEDGPTPTRVLLLCFGVFLVAQIWNLSALWLCFVSACAGSSSSC